MSVWTNITGVIWFDWCSFSRDDAKLIDARYDSIKNVIERNKPRVSEGEIWYKFTKRDINLVVIGGSLREFDDEKIIEEFKPWWDSLMKIPYVRQAVVSCTTNRETHIFEKRIKHDADLNKEMLKIYGPDPGIVIHTDRDVRIEKSK